MSNRNSYTNILVLRDHVTNLVVLSSDISAVDWFTILSRSGSVNCLRLVQSHLCANVVMFRHFDHLGVNSSSRNIVIHGSHRLRSLSREGDNLLLVMNRL